MGGCRRGLLVQHTELYVSGTTSSADIPAFQLLLGVGASFAPNR